MIFNLTVELCEVSDSVPQQQTEPMIELLKIKTLLNRLRILLQKAGFFTR